MRSKTVFSLILLFWAVLFISGCSDELSSMLDEDQTEYDSRRILEETSSINKDPNIVTDPPEVYTRPSKILKTTEGVKIFYFAKNKSPKALVGLIKQQMGVKVVNTNTGTNQLIINCADENEAEEVLDYIEKIDVQAIQIKVECTVIENYADFTMDRETAVKVGEVLGDDFVISGSRRKNGGLWGFFPGGSMREEPRASYGMSTGYSSSDISFLVDMLSSRGYLKVIMNPVVTTAANNSATIISKDRVPIVKIKTGKDIKPYNMTEYEWVEDSLTITPAVYADGSVGLSGHIKFGSKSTPEGIVQNRIITERSIDLKETRVPVGNSLVLGGFKKSEKFSVIRGFPLLKDLPLIGFMFSSKDFEERAKEITFILTPSVASEGIEFNDMVDQVEELHKTHRSEESIAERITGIVADPLSESGYRRRIEKMAAQETIEKMEAEVEAARTEREAEKARKRLEDFKAKLEAGRQASDKAKKAAQEYKEKLKTLKDVQKKLQQAQKEQTEESKSQIEATKAEYEKIAKEAEKLKKEFEQKQSQAKEKTRQLEEANEQIEKLLDENKKLSEQKEQLERRKQQAEKEAKAKAEPESREADAGEQQDESENAEQNPDKESSPKEDSGSEEQ